MSGPSTTVTAALVALLAGSICSTSALAQTTPTTAPSQPAQPAATATAATTGASATPPSTAVALTPEELEQAYRLHSEGGQYLNKKDYRKAVARLGEALKINPGLRDCWFDLALAYTYAREFKFAEFCIEKVKKMGGDATFLSAELTKARPKEPETPATVVSKGLEPGNVFGITVPKKAPTEAQQALAAQYQSAGGRYLDTKQYALAIEQYKQALGINPGLEDGWFDFTLALIYSGEHDLAQAAIDELKKLGGKTDFLTGELAKARPGGAAPAAPAPANNAPPGLGQ